MKFKENTIKRLKKTKVKENKILPNRSSLVFKEVAEGNKIISG